MLTALILMLMPQDGSIRTAPEPAEVPVPVSTPAPQDGRVVWNQRPLEPARTRVSSIEDCKNAWLRPEGQSEAACAADFQREADASNALAATGADANPPAAAERPGAEAGATPGEGRYRRLRDAVAATGRAVAPPESGVPAWALTDPARWETSQCGAAGNDTCRRQARNRLAMARAGVAAEPPAAGGAPAPTETCRMVMQRSETGFGGSLSRICSTGPEAEALLPPLDALPGPVVEPCDRPASLETQDAWIARCRALPQR